jgi:uncharacterized damage-inducible protein DinB
MGFEAPRTIVPTSEERELLLRFLQRKREQVVATASDLSDEQAAWTPQGRLLPIGGVINHLTHVEWRWIDGRYLGCEFPPREEEFQIGEASLSELIDAYWRRSQRTEEVVREAPSLDAPCMGTEGTFPPAHVLFGFSEPVDLRWSVLHLIEETAHHAGHADATREMLDGKAAG